MIENYQTGQIVAMASYPTFDNRWFTVGLTGKKFKVLFPETDDPDKSILVNRAIQGQYNLGSTFKPFVAYTGLVSGVITPEFKFKLAWTNPDFGMHFNTPIHKDGYLYGFDGRNEPDASLACVEAKTGKVMWRTNPEWKESFSAGGQIREPLLSTYRGNLLQVDGRFLALGELGHLLWMDLTASGYKEGSRGWLFAARETWSPPVLSHGLLYIVQHTKDSINGKGPRLMCYNMRD